MKKTVMSNLKTHASKSPDDTFKIASELALTINKPVLIGLSGEMGVGKTVFAKGFAQGLDVKELITSPTFLGVSECYSGRMPFIHMDFYKKVIAKKDIEYYLEKKSIILIEWIENFNLVFGDNLSPQISVYIQYLKDKAGNYLNNERQIKVEY